jgi:hypothetical protein
MTACYVEKSLDSLKIRQVLFHADSAATLEVGFDRAMIEAADEVLRFEESGGSCRKAPGLAVSIVFQHRH